MNGDTGSASRAPVEKCFQVGNPGNAPVDVLVDVEPAASGWLDARPPRARLGPGESLDVRVRASPGEAERSGWVRVRAGSEVREVVVTVPAAAGEAGGLTPGGAGDILMFGARAPRPAPAGGAPAAMNDIFISYASQDRPRAALFAMALQKAGWSVWWDHSIPPGKTFDQVIEEAIDASKCVVVLWSQESIKSHWVRTEAAEGLRRQSLVPVLIDDVKIPLEFRRIQAARLVGWDGVSPHPELEKLRAAVEGIVGSPTPRRAQASPAHGEPSPPAGSSLPAPEAGPAALEAAHPSLTLAKKIRLGIYVHLASFYFMLATLGLLFTAKEPVDLQMSAFFLGLGVCMAYGLFVWTLGRGTSLGSSARWLGLFALFLPLTLVGVEFLATVGGEEAGFGESYQSAGALLWLGMAGLIPLILGRSILLRLHHAGLEPRRWESRPGPSYAAAAVVTVLSAVLASRVRQEAPQPPPSPPAAAHREPAPRPSEPAGPPTLMGAPGPEPPAPPSPTAARPAPKVPVPELPEPARGGREAIEWVRIPGGSFMMGSEGGAVDEKPRHRAVVSAFEMA